MIRQRARRACGPCRKRKVRCNGAYPCDICEGYGYDCDFAEEDTKVAKRARTEEVASKATETALNALVDGHTAKPAHDSSHQLRIQSEPSDGQRFFVLVEVPNMKCPMLSSSPFPESFISRFTTVDSAVAFPRDLGQSLGMPDAPRLHPFGWHTGTREERPLSVGNRLFDQIPLQDALQFSSAYFKMLHPLFSILSPTHFTKTCVAVWSLRQMSIDLEAAFCGVIALGSLFASGITPWSPESGIVEQGRLLLEISISFPPSQLSVKFVVAWLLRAIYLRCTTRPHLSWMATCNAMHIAETIGLHQDFGNMDFLHNRTREAVMKETITRRKTFWIAVSLNRLFSVEYGRTPVQLSSISCSPLYPEGDADLTVAFVDLCQLLPRNSHDSTKGSVQTEDLAFALQRLGDQPARDPPFALLKAEVCFSVFRKMRFLHLPLTSPQTEIVIRIIRAGLLEAQSLSHTGAKWWSILSIPFHSVAVLIAMDTPASLALLADATTALQTVVDVYDTYLAREALATAEQLVRAYRAKKLREAEAVGRALEATRDGKALRSGENLGVAGLMPATEVPLGFDWPCGDDGSWMEVFFDMGMGQRS